ncbi:hypothetical protein H2248_008316 [Termitomyces sp. 'cryptogamus']|nr:hypothetical protein H2248_008316 [Termitomyces sp. 'cryptogamus']
MSFIFAATDTTSDALSHTLHLLALHPDIQERLRAEVTESAEKLFVMRAAQFIPLLAEYAARNHFGRLAEPSTNGNRCRPVENTYDGPVAD